MGQARHPLGAPSTGESGSKTTPSGSWRTLASGTGLQGAAQVGQLAINLALTPYVIHGLGHERFGVYLLISTLTVVMGSFDGGIGPSALRFFTLYAGAGDRRSLTRLLSSLLAVVSASTVVIFPLIVWAAPTLLTFFKVSDALEPEALFLLRSLTVLVGILIARNLFVSVLYAHRRFAITALSTMASYLAYAGGLVLTVERGWGLRGAAYTFIAQQVVATAVTVPAAWRHLDLSARGWIGGRALREFFGYAWKVQVTSLITLLMAQKDQFVAARLLGAQQSGPYGQGANFAQQLKTLPLNALSPMQAVIGNAVGAGGDEARAQAAQIQRVWVRLVAGWSAVGVPAVYFGVRAWLPDSYTVAADVAAILLVGQFFVLAVSVLIVWALSMGHPELDLRYGVVGLGLNVLLSLALGWPFGILGVVCATAVSQALAALWLSFDAHRTLPVTLPWFGHGFPVLASVAAAALTFAAELFAHPHLPRGAAGMVLSGLLAVPGLLLYAAWVFGPSQLRGIRDLFGGARAR